MKFQNSIQKKQIVILGAGESGAGAAMLAAKKGYNVFVSDNGKIQNKQKMILNKHKINWEEDRHTLKKILHADEIIKSPGIPEKCDLIQTIRASGIKIISEIEFASRYTNSIMIAITGSNGKTTTSNLAFHLLKKAGFNVGLAGNVGVSFARMVATKNYDYYVLELSSFQLDDMYSFRAHIAILLNVTPDHLDRYDYKFSKYLKSKFRITRNQTEEDYLVFNADDDEIIKELKMKNEKLKMNLLPFSIKKELKNGGYVKNKNLMINYNNKTEKIMSTEMLSLQGKHNVYN